MHPAYRLFGRQVHRDEGLTSATQAASIILEGVKANRWRILVEVDAHKIDEMVRQSPDRAYDVAFFDEFARAAGWTERLSGCLPDPAVLVAPDNDWNGW